MVRRGSITLEAARGGDRDGLAELWRTHQAPLLRYLRTRRMASPDDVASQVWVDVARSITRFEGDADDFRRWLFTIAHRRSVDEVRRAVRAADVPTPIAGHAAGADSDHELSSALERAIEMLSALPENLAEAVMLRVVNDMSIADVAAVMNTSEGNVRVLVHRGLTRLRRKLAVTPVDAQAMKRVS
jgi:RNA polymerase sigma-70 factor (ECF subfamily)